MKKECFMNERSVSRTKGVSHERKECLMNERSVS